MQKIDLVGLNTNFYIRIFDRDMDFTRSKKIQPTLQAVIVDFESKYSRFRLDSDLSKLNSEGFGEILDPEFYELLKFGQQMMEASLGFFNIGMAGYLEALGYDRNYTFQTKSNLPPIPSKLFQVLTPKKVVLEKSVKLDFGGFGKGYLVDKLAKVLKGRGIKYFYINAGGDILATTNYHKPFTFLLQNPLKNKEFIGQIEVSNQAIAASNSSFRNWTNPKTKLQYSHLINPKPVAENYKSVSKSKLGVFTIAKNCLLADTLATTLFVARSQDARVIAQNLKGDFLLLYSNMSIFRSSGYRFQSLA